MILAVTYEDEMVFQHFGHTQEFKLYRIEENKIKESAVVSALGSGHSALAGFLQSYHVEALICGGIGGGARIALAQMGIRLYPGVEGNADEQVHKFIKNELDYDPDKVCNHHDHDHEHCAEHDEHCGHLCGE